MFITEQVAYIKANYGGGWTVRFCDIAPIFSIQQSALALSFRSRGD